MRLVPQLGGQAAAIGLDLITQLDACQRLGCDRRMAADVNLIELAAQMTPA
jgi:hypothetical protein